MSGGLTANAFDRGRLTVNADSGVSIGRLVRKAFPNYAVALTVCHRSFRAYSGFSDKSYGLALKSIVQLVFHGTPSSLEKACSQRSSSALERTQMNRTVIGIPLQVSSA